MPRPSRRESGQMVVLFALSLIGLVLLVGLVIDSGFAFAQRRGTQNAADFAATAGTRIVAQARIGDAVNGTDGNVKNSIQAVLAANHALPATFDAASGPRYVDRSGTRLTYVGDPALAGAIPTSAYGVAVGARTTWRPFLLGVIGMNNWTASADAVAITPSNGASGGVVPFGVSVSSVSGGGAYSVCPSGQTAESCGTHHLTPGSLNTPGGFGWLKFGCYARTDADGKRYGLGQVLPAASGGCSNSKPFLDDEWGTPPAPPNTFGCCTSISASTAAGFGNDIGSLPGNKASVNDGTPAINYDETNNLWVWVPIWDTANGNGSNGYYHIIGYSAFEIVHIKGGKDIEGVLRLALDPATGKPYDSPDPNLLLNYSGAVQLVR
jgi:Flp pilus assembly protein TadG